MFFSCLTRAEYTAF